MNAHRFAGLCLVGFCAVAGAAHAQNAALAPEVPAATVSSTDAQALQPAGKTRAEVRAELIAAQRAGAIPVGYIAMTGRELDPAAYPLGDDAQRLALTKKADQR
jgi:hypothetical protein